MRYSAGQCLSVSAWLLQLFDRDLGFCSLSMASTCTITLVARMTIFRNNSSISRSNGRKPANAENQDVKFGRGFSSWAPQISLGLQRACGLTRDNLRVCGPSVEVKCVPCRHGPRTAAWQCKLLLLLLLLLLFYYVLFVFPLFGLSLKE